MSTTSNIKGAFDSLLAAASSADLSDNSPEDNNNNTSVASAKKKASNRNSFPRKLYNILEDEDASIINWTANGDAFIVHDNDRFSTDILPRYFRHTKVRVVVYYVFSMYCITFIFTHIYII